VIRAADARRAASIMSSSSSMFSAGAFVGCTMKMFGAADVLVDTDEQLAVGEACERDLA